MNLVTIHVSVTPLAVSDLSYSPVAGEADWKFVSESCPTAIEEKKMLDLIAEAWSQAHTVRIERDKKGLITRITKRIGFPHAS